MFEKYVPQIIAQMFNQPSADVQTQAHLTQTSSDDAYSGMANKIIDLKSYIETEL